MKRAIGSAARRSSHFPEPVRDVVATPLAHDTLAEIAQSEIRDWRTGEVEPVPGKTMPGLRIVTIGTSIGNTFPSDRKPGPEGWGRTARITKSKTSTMRP